MRKKGKSQKTRNARREDGAEASVRTLRAYTRKERERSSVRGMPTTTNAGEHCDLDGVSAQLRNTRDDHTCYE